jgi:Opacity protein and related surface antigens
MKSLTAVTLASAMLAGMAAPSLAQSEFDGAYAVVNGGYGYSALSTDAFGGTIDSSGHGFLGGVSGGYGHSIGDFYIGGEVGLDLSDIETDFTAGGATVDLNRKGSVGAVARAGFMPADDLLVYGAGGVSLGYYEGDVARGLNTGNNNGWQRAYRVGAGVDRSISSDAFVRAGVDVDFVNENSVSVTTGAAKVGLGFRF